MFDPPLLSAVGELADPSSLGPLHDLVCAEDADLLVADPQADESDAESSSCRFPASGMIQARAVEMFAWIAAGREDDRLLRIMPKSRVDRWVSMFDPPKSRVDRWVSMFSQVARRSVGVYV